MGLSWWDKGGVLDRQKVDPNVRRLLDQMSGCLKVQEERRSEESKKDFFWTVEPQLDTVSGQNSEQEEPFGGPAVT